MCNDEKQVAAGHVPSNLPGAITSTDLKGFKAAVNFLEQHKTWLKGQLQQAAAIDWDLIQPVFVVDVIISDPKNKGKCKVSPPRLEGVVPGEKVLFWNATKDTVTVTFDCGGVVTPNPLTIKGGKMASVIIAQEVSHQPLECEYTVDCTGSGGGPTMIIEDPETGT